MSRLGRRTFLLATASAGIARALPQTCRVNSEQEVGPFFIDGVNRALELARGVPLHVRMELVDTRCAPLSHALVDIWHCDALGIYSGFDEMPPGPPPGDPHSGPPPGGHGPPHMVPTHPERTLRGQLRADEHGVVELATVYPGWYHGRAIHVHYKVHTQEHVSHVGQLFFPEDVTDDIALLPPYNTRRTIARTLQREDHIFTEQGGAAGLVTLARVSKSDLAAGLSGTTRVTVDPSAHPAEVQPNFPGPPR